MAGFRKTDSWFESSFAGSANSGPPVKISRSKTEVHPSTSRATQNEKTRGRKRTAASTVKQKPRQNRDGGTDSSLPWTDRFLPKNREELAVNSKKLLEIEAWLKEHRDKPDFLLLTGISGCGKTVAIRMLCKELDYGVKEWTNSNSSYAKPHEEFLEENVKELTFDESQTRQFSKFMLRADYGTLNLAGKSNAASACGHQVVLVKDFPNVFYRDPSALHDVLRRYRKFGKRPVVFIVSESPTSSDLNARRMFPVRICEELNLRTIGLNPVALRSMIKALRQILNNAGVTEDKETVTEIADMSAGDMRMAVNSLQMTFGASQKWKSRKNPVLSVSSRDQTMLLFSALGKFLYSKRVDEGSGNANVFVHLPEHLSAKTRIRELSFDPEEVISRSSLSPDSFVQFLHENYWNLFPEWALEGAVAAVDDLSLADSLSVDWTTRNVANEQYVGCISARSIAFHNSEPHELKHQRHLIRRPKWKDVFFDVSKNVPEMTDAFLELRLSAGELSCEIIPYLKLMKCENLRSETQWQIVNRLGKWTSNLAERANSRFLSDGVDYVNSEYSDSSGGWSNRPKKESDRNNMSFVDVGENSEYDIGEYSDSD